MASDADADGANEWCEGDVDAACYFERERCNMRAYNYETEEFECIWWGTESVFCILWLNGRCSISEEDVESILN